MASLSQGDLPQKVLQLVPRFVPSRNFFGGVFPAHRSGDSFGKCWGYRRGHRGLPDGGSGRARTPQWTRNPGRRNATRRRSRSRPPAPLAHGRPGPLAAPRRWSSSACSWTRTGRGSRECGRGRAGGDGPVPSAARGPKRSARERSDGASTRVARAQPESGSDGPTSPSHRPSWWRTWPRRRRPLPSRPPGPDRGPGCRPDVPQRARRSAELGTPGHGHDRVRHSPLDRPGEDGTADPRGWWFSRPGGSVGSHDNVEMDEPTALELDHLDVGEAGQLAQLGGPDAGGPGHLSIELERSAFPQPGHVGVPKNGSGVVEALRTERLSDELVLGVVADEAGQRDPVIAHRVPASRAAQSTP